MIHIRKYHYFFILFHFKIIFTQFYIFERKLRILLIELIAILFFCALRGYCCVFRYYRGLPPPSVILSPLRGYGFHPLERKGISY